MGLAEFAKSSRRGEVAGFSLVRSSPQAGWALGVDRGLAIWRKNERRAYA
jgi:hypothetical protein